MARRLDPLKYRRNRRKSEATPERAKKRRETRLRRRYKLSISKIFLLLIEQKFKCLICKTPITYPGIEKAEYRGYVEDEATNAVVDHSHRDGHVRGLLCSACNVALGLFEDNMKYIKAAYFYLKRDKELSS